MKLLDYTVFFSHPLLAEGFLASWQHELSIAVENGFNEARYGDIPRWRDALLRLPGLGDSLQIKLDQAIVSVASSGSIPLGQQQQLKTALKGLMPWRKGPFSVADVLIDTEWRSDKKWDRLCNAIKPLAGRKVLDVGCGSGYHCWRMRGAGAEFVIGIEPSPLFVMQYWALQKYIKDHSTWVLPMGVEQLPASMHAFDTVFSMGILYHRRSPIDHLLELRDTLRSGGELVLETLVIEGGEHEVLLPEGRYAKMGNVWFIPTISMLERWLKKLRFTEIKVVDVSVTDCSEQRATEWMNFQSLPDFLDNDNHSLTVEGHPAPCRAIVTATAP